MANQRLIALNGTGGAFVNIAATVSVRLIEAKEDEGGSTEGIQVMSSMDNFATINTFSFASEPISIPDPLAYPLKGRLIGMPAQGQAGAFNAIPATTILSARSDAAAGTTLRVAEYE